MDIRYVLWRVREVWFGSTATRPCIGGPGDPGPLDLTGRRKSVDPNSFKSWTKDPGVEVSRERSMEVRTTSNRSEKGCNYAEEVGHIWPCPLHPDSENGPYGPRQRHTPTRPWEPPVYRLLRVPSC